MLSSKIMLVAIIMSFIPIQVYDVSNFSLVDFDLSMQAHFYPDLFQKEEYAQEFFNFFKKLYDKNNPIKMQPSQNYRIPKILHHVWLGGKLPDEYEPYYQSWLKKHPDWRFIFWTDSEKNYDKGRLVSNFTELQTLLEKSDEKFFVVDTHELVFENKKFFDAAINYGEKSDILKWEVVYRFGGAYVDTDFECLNPLDQFNKMYDFYTGLQPLDTNMVQLGAALFAAIPNHPIMFYCVNRIKYNQHISAIVAKTGPLHFTQIFLQVADRFGLKDIALPASYFYPCSYEQRGMPRDIWCKAESYAVHHWAGSWLKPEAFVKNYA